MSYQKYTTEAFVLGNMERGEADKVLVLYTRDFGLVYGRCVGVRKEHSRMRCALQDYALARVSLVRGKRGWRVTGAIPVAGVGGMSREGVFALSRIALLVRRLIHGEEGNAYLFDVLSDTHEQFAEVRGEQSLIELICVARLLYALGYLSTEALGSALFIQTSYRDSALSEARTKHEALLKNVNEAIAESQL